MKVELLYWDGCPSHAEALALLEEVMAAKGVEATVELREITSKAEAVEERLPGSPTIRVDGRDIDSVGANPRPALTCRLYYLPGGKVSPVLSREALEEALA